MFRKSKFQVTQKKNKNQGISRKTEICPEEKEEICAESGNDFSKALTIVGFCDLIIIVK